MGISRPSNPRLAAINIVGYCGSPDIDKELYDRRFAGLLKQVSYIKNMTRHTGTQVFVAVYRASGEEIARLRDGKSDHLHIRNYGDNLGPGGFRNSLWRDSLSAFFDEETSSDLNGWVLNLDCGDLIKNSFCSRDYAYSDHYAAINSALVHADLCGAKVVAPVQVDNDHSMIDSAQQRGVGYELSTFVPGPGHFVLRDGRYDFHACQYDTELFPVVNGRITPGEDFEMAVQYMAKGWNMITAQFLELREESSSEVGSLDSLWSKGMKPDSLDRKEIERKIATKHFSQDPILWDEYKTVSFDSALDLMYSNAKGE